MTKEEEFASTKTNNNNSDCTTAFKKAQLRYKKRRNASDEDDSRFDYDDELVDFSRNDHRIERVIVQDHHCYSRFDDEERFYQGPVYCLKEEEGGNNNNKFAGFYYCPQALSEDLQQQLAYKAVTTFCERPYVTNIDLVPPKASEIVENDNSSESSMWELWKDENGFGCCRDEDGSSSSSFSSMNSTLSAEKQRHSKKNKKYYRRFDKLSWATLGYNYDWTARTYHQQQDCSKSRVPADLERLAQRFAATALLDHDGDPTSTSNDTSLSFVAEAGIVNYYNEKSLMGGHRDDSELALDKPIVSFSLGRPAIFLLGGPTKNDTPIVPILVRPGDVMLMGGTTRLNYHAMVRLLPAAADVHSRLPPPDVTASQLPTPDQQVSCLELDSHDDHHQDDSGTPSKQLPTEVDKDALQVYLSQHRININLRQVYP